ncbi:transcriptional regulator, TetR family [Peribacillus simplex]|uniref:Transcriptional regulator, TetR family n=1 Tax=Peribacillus simplex TaxID=1478 RepID=A0A9X8WMY9_9BACI|nr:TetR/AcrR family transcriptional regulator [Peribacillus simplex]SIS03741.1 transcriptional regulator, TetR family [Peribacillus simplex]
MKKEARVDNVEKYITKLKPIISKTRFSQLTIDEISKHMDISKATLYKYFSSRDEIIQVAVEHTINYLNEADSSIQDESISYVERFQKIYEQSVKCVIYISDVFLYDLKESYPDLYDNLSVARQKRYKNLQTFFDSGMDMGIFNRVNTALFMVQDDAVLRSIMKQSFCIQFDLTLKQALIDFYQLKKLQLFKPEFIDTVDDSVIEKQIVQIIQTIS